MVEQLKGEDAGPKDNLKVVYIIFYWLGIGTLLPWNMFITVSIIVLATVIVKTSHGWIFELLIINLRKQKLSNR